jgi:hypothetical protein
VRTVRSAARSRNQPRRGYALVIAAVIFGLIALLAHAAAAQQLDPRTRIPDADELDDEDDALDKSEPPLASPEDLAALPVAPPVARVIAAAQTAAGLDRDPGRGWVARTRLAGLVPLVSVAEGSDSTWHEVNPNIGRQSYVEVRASWHLDRLLFDPNELHISTIESSRRRERRRIANLVIRAYFAWRRASAAAIRHPRWATHAEQAAAELDALTNGWFTASLTDLYPAARPAGASPSQPPAEHHDRP